MEVMAIALIVPHHRVAWNIRHSVRGVAVSLHFLACHMVPSTHASEEGWVQSNGLTIPASH